ncbi:MAG: aldo/keto reductase [Phycisphaerales bacterium]|nr:aldo/keto reductase [Phycisphaerales bacterium]
MEYRSLGRTGLTTSALGWGTVKLGRNIDVKYPASFDLPSDQEACDIVLAMLDLGITLIDTAPAYGLSESRLGIALANRRQEVVLSSKVGEQFQDGRSHFDFTGAAARRSVEASLRRLGTDHLDILLIHSDGRDEWIQRETDLIETLKSIKAEGKTRAIGLSGKTPEGAGLALAWADVLMCPWHPLDRSHESVMASARSTGLGVLAKKVLASGHAADPQSALKESMSHADAAVIGSLSPTRMHANCGVLESPESEPRLGDH